MNKPASLALLVLALTSAPVGWRHQEPANPGWAELAKSMERMHDAMNSAKPSGDSDLDFVTLMLPHHQAALDMAKVQLIYGKDPQMRRLAQEIVTDQQSEIEVMQLWLKQHRPGQK